MAKLTVNDIPVEVEDGSTVLQACEAVGIEIPVFCYHPRLSIAGNCRMCLVEMDKSPKPIASCSMPVSEGMVIRTNTPMVEKARKGVLELLLINHPLDCPICDQGGECDLQDITMSYGPSCSRFEMNKRAVTNKHMGPLIKTIMNRCIHCTRCVRFMNEVAGVQEMGGIHRGEKTEITTYLEQGIHSELSGNIIDICPVGALTNRPYSFHGRPWELTKTDSIDVMDAVGSNIRIDTAKRQVMRILPRLNEKVNEEWISDKTRFSYDGLSKQRLDRPYIRRNGKLEESSWEDALNIVAQKLKGTNPKQVAALVGDMADCESTVVLKDILDSLGVVHYDCRQDESLLDSSIRTSYLFNTTISGIDKTDFILLIGSDVRHEAPLINARIRKRYLASGTNGLPPVTIASIGPKYDLTYPYMNLGDTAPILKEILEGNHSICDSMRKSKYPMLILGQGALTRRDSREILRLSQEIAEKYNMIQESSNESDCWNGFNVLHTAAARVGSLDIGFTPPSGGMDTHNILLGCQKGEIQVIFLSGVDEISSNQYGDAFVIYMGHHGDQGAHRADVILPSLAYTEKSATYVNTEGRPQRTNQALKGPGQAQEDWLILRRLALKMEIPLAYSTIEGVRGRLMDVKYTFAYIDFIRPTPWDKFKSSVPETLSHVPFKSSIQNYYMTDVISRHSKIMAECTAELTEEKQVKYA